jgi:O-antigen/teichoic acid export membrane protein
MIARKSVLIITTKLIDGSLGYLGLFFIARYMNPSDYGIVSFAMGFVTLFTIFCSLGFTQAHVKRVSEGKNLGKCIGTYLSIKLLLLTLATIILFTSLYFWTNILGRGFETPEHLSAIYIIVGFWVVQQIIESFSSTYKARKEIAKYELPYLLNAIVRTSAIIYVALSGMGALALAWTYVAGVVAHLGVVLLFFRNYPVEKPTKDYIKSYSVFAFPLMLVTTSSVIMHNIDKVMIQLFWNAADVGYYFAAFRVSNFITMFTSAIGLLIFPTYSALHKAGNILEIKKLTFDSERHLSLITFPMVFGLVILAEPTAFILLSGWMPAVPLLQILPFVVLLKTLSIPYEAQFNGMDRPEINRNRIIIMLIFNVTLNIILIPKDLQMLGGIKLFGLGATGAAIATATSFLVSLIYTRIMSYRLTKSKGNIRVLLHAFAAIVMAAALNLLLYTFNYVSWVTRWYHLLIFGAIGLTIYLFILSIFREFKKEDFWFYLDALNIRKMFQYIKEELGRSKK